MELHLTWMCGVASDRTKTPYAPTSVCTSSFIVSSEIVANLFFSNIEYNFNDIGSMMTDIGHIKIGNILY